MSNYENREQLIKDAKAVIDTLVESGMLRDECKRVVKKLFLESFDELGINFDNVAGNYMRRNCPKCRVITEDDMEGIEMPDVEVYPTRLQLEFFVPDGENPPNEAQLLIEEGYPIDLYEYYDRKNFCRKFNGETGNIWRYFYRKKNYTYGSAQSMREFVCEQYGLVKEQIAEFDNRKQIELIPPVQNPKLGVLQICDVHYGAECNKEEHGINWGAKECEEDVDYIVSQAIDKIKREGVNKILLVMTGDGMNSDTLDHTTAHGTQQHDCLDPDQIFKGYARICISAINRITTEGGVPVEFIHTVGNHDELAGMHLTSTLDLVFDNNPNVKIGDERNFRKYRKFGKSLLMFSHGQQEGRRVQTLPAMEEPKAWGDAKYAYVITEHTHQYGLNPNGRVFQYIGATIAPPGTWTNRSGYIGARRGAAFYVFDYEKCLDSVSYLDVKYDEIASHVIDAYEDIC